jgi:hypothetical protein
MTDTNQNAQTETERDRQAQAIVDRILAEAGCPKKK